MADRERPVEEALVIETRVAKVGQGEHHFCGYPATSKLLGRQSSAGMLLLAVGAGPGSAEDHAVLNDVAVALTAGDPRAWPMKIARLVASYGDFFAGWAASSLFLPEAQLGPSTSGQAADWLHGVAALADDPVVRGERFDAVVREVLLGRQRLPGFGVPFRDVDERLAALRGALERRGRCQRRFWQIMDAVATIVRRERQLEPNIGLGLAACLLDLGLQPPQVPRLLAALAAHMFVANAAEGADQAAAVLRELPLDRVDYQGPEPRQSPRARAKANER